MEIKGDITVKRTGVFDRRADQGLNTSTSDSVTFVRHDAWWQRLAGTVGPTIAAQLPDATELPNGWSIVIEASGSYDVEVTDDAAGALATIVPGVSTAVMFTLVDNGSAAGVWYQTSFENAGVTPATRYTQLHNATSDWTDADPYWTILVDEATHGRGTSPVIQHFWDVNADESDLQLVHVDLDSVNASGDLTFRVPYSPDIRFDGKVIIV